MKSFYDSPIGLICIESTEKGVSSLVFADSAEGGEHRAKGEGHGADGILARCVDQLEEYFNKKRKIFELDLDLQGTDFQKRVWTELLKIPFGKTISYKDLALRLGDLKAIRAAGTANGANPVSIIVPCHRVIGSDGSLTGYAGGLWRKQWLLEFETQGRLLF